MNTSLFGILLLSLSPSDGTGLLQPATMPGMCLAIDEDEGSVSSPCSQSPTQRLTLPRSDAGPIRLEEHCLAPRGTGYFIRRCLLSLATGRKRNNGRCRPRASCATPPDAAWRCSGCRAAIASEYMPEIVPRNGYVFSPSM